jgi:hypothetical protein
MKWGREERLKAWDMLSESGEREAELRASETMRSEMERAHRTRKESSVQAQIDKLAQDAEQVEARLMKLDQHLKIASVRQEALDDAINLLNDHGMTEAGWLVRRLKWVEQ